MMTHSSTPRRLAPCALALAALLVSMPAAAAKAPAKKPAAKSDSTAKATLHASPVSGATAAVSSMAVTVPGLPHYAPPAAYSEDLVITTEGKEMIMHRSVDGGRIRTDINAEGQDIVMIELGDEKGTMVVLMPEQKRAMKQSRQALEQVSPQLQQQAAKTGPTTAPPDAKVEDLGETTLDGRTVRKIRMSTHEGSALGWFDKETGAPVRMESEVEGKTVSMEWKNMKPGPQPASSFQVPKDYEVMDMDEMMAQMKSMGGTAGMSASALLGGVSGMGGMGMAGGAKGMAGGMASQFGSQMGASLGGTLGASLGGPLGAMAGQYLGGMIGGAIAKKTADTVIPGK